jgi:hypothetical protein
LHAGDHQGGCGSLARSVPNDETETVFGELEAVETVAADSMQLAAFRRVVQSIFLATLSAQHQAFLYRPGSNQIRLVLNIYFDSALHLCFLSANVGRNGWWRIDIQCDGNSKTRR